MTEYYFSPASGGPLRKIRKAVGLVPEKGLGLRLRVALLVGIAWLPIVIGALIAGQAIGGVPDPLLRHFGVHARFLISIPLLIFAEGFMERIIPKMVRHFATSGLICDDDLPKFEEALASATRLRDSIWGSVVVLGIVGFIVVTSSVSSEIVEEMSWAVSQSDSGPRIGFAGWWFTFVSRPIFGGLLVIWIWRILALWFLFWKISKIDLRLVASHPDQVGGLGFLEGLAVACAPLVLAISIVLAGRWGHEVLYHGVHLDDLKPLAAAFVVTMLVVFNGPLLVLGRNTRSFKRARLLEYSTLAGNHGHLIYERWIRNRDVGSPEVLSAPELGPAADVATLYQSVAGMRFAPIGKASILSIVAAACLPMLPVVAIEIPVKQMLGSLAGALL